MKQTMGIAAILAVAILACLAWGIWCASAAHGQTVRVEGGEVAPATTADVVRDMKAALAKDPTARLNTLKGYDPNDKIAYRDALVAEADTMQGAEKVQRLVTVYSNFVGWGKDETNLKDRVAAAIGTITDPTEKAKAAGAILRQAHLLRTVALGLVDTPGLDPDAQRNADALGVLKGRLAAKNVVSAWNTRIVPNADKLKALYGPEKTDLKRILVLIPVAEHANYVAAVNAWLVRSRTADLAQTSGDYQTFLKDGTGGVDLLAGVALPTDDAIAQQAAKELQRADLTVDARVDMLLLLGRTREAFVLAEKTLNAGSGAASANVYRVAKVIKALDGHWKRATDYVNLFQPRAEGVPAPVDPIPAVKQEFGL